jgi:hypothetical protein
LPAFYKFASGHERFGRRIARPSRRPVSCFETFFDWQPWNLENQEMLFRGAGVMPITPESLNQNENLEGRGK